jgi:RNA polymerase sigma-70 factor (ECF subfamily)
MVMDARTSPTQRWDSELEAAYREHRAMLYAVALRLLRDKGEAEDCVHDTIARLWHNGHAYTPARGSFVAYLVVCVRNEALTKVRKRANRSRIEREKFDRDDAEPAIDLPIVERSAMAQAMQSLSAAQRETIRLAYFQGLTHEQIAKRMGEPVGTVKSRISTSLRALRAYFQAEKDLP